MNKPKLWWKQKWGCWYVHHTMLPDCYVSLEAGYPRGFSAKFCVLAFPSVKDFHKVLARYEKEPKRIKGYCLSSTKRNGLAPSILLPISCSRGTAIHEALHAAITVFQKRKWSVMKKEEGFVVTAQAISECVLKDLAWCRKQKRRK